MSVESIEKKRKELVKSSLGDDKRKHLLERWVESLDIFEKKVVLDLILNDFEDEMFPSYNKRTSGFSDAEANRVKSFIGDTEPESFAGLSCFTETDTDSDKHLLAFIAARRVYRCYSGHGSLGSIFDAMCEKIIPDSLTTCYDFDNHIRCKGLSVQPWLVGREYYSVLMNKEDEQSSTEPTTEE